ncbi:Response regulator receiver domain-containing protein [Paenibacillus catalpae]|uniref:Response regulator receiver domain-containing protein n=1 Tax=Paenibacillus catalpae TaxID=1045775 RepID=A0A1I2EA59_9BACL|nr:helix-turn-helix domain-containing protein [Paenibacillus catalpae]SFE89486.1 Response regulator receiver domain-containing protein [Paenibacillus catalpae]
MFKVMVVDDELWGRKSVGKMIAELQLDIEVVAEARNGAEAMELIPVSKPHIIVTDMNMPVMNGQQFLEQLYHRYNHIKVVVISGHAQFEYMKAAVAFQACEYVLKPVSPVDLKDAMVKAIQASRSHMSLEQREQFASEMRKLRTEAFLQNVTSRRIANTADIISQAAELLSSPRIGRYRLAVCMLRRFRELAETKFNGNADLLMYSLENMMSELTSGEPLYVFKSDDRLRLCLLLPESETDGATVQELLLPFHETVSRMLNLHAVVGLSEPRVRLDQLPEAFEEASDRLCGSMLRGTDFAVKMTDVPTEMQERSEVLGGFDAKLLQQAIASGQAASVRRMLGEFARKAELADSLTIRSAQKELRKLGAAAGSKWPVIAAASPLLSDHRAIESVMTISALHDYVSELSAAIETHIQSKSATDATNPMGDIVAYLDGHYFEDVGLIDIATRYHMDPSYLSRQFKAATGENFIEYVTRKRMEKACELLRQSDSKVSDIAELVGYENQRYFSQVFKKFTGRTPSEFRESLPSLFPPAKN